MSNKNFSIIIYILSSIIVLALSLFIYKIIANTSNLNTASALTLSKYSEDNFYNNYTFKIKKESKILLNSDST